MDNSILITELNDFIFCPVSIYFHKLYGDMDRIIYQSEYQINGTNAHKSVDEGEYSSLKSVLMGIDVYSERYNIIGKIDILYIDKKILRERKKKIKTVYDGYIFQLYAQYFALTEMGYDVSKIELYSMDDHKIYNVKLPSDDKQMMEKFEKTIYEIKNFDLNTFVQNNSLKCQNCIYEPACDRSLI